VSESTTKERGRRKTLIGIVVSNKMDKTAVVSVERRYPHPLYHKIIKSSKRYKAHDPKNEAVLGDVVRLEETRPLSKEKRWRIAETLTRGNVADIAPREIGVPEEALLEKQAPPAPAAAAAVAEPAAEAPAAPDTAAPAAAEAETAPEVTDSEVAPKGDDNDVIDTPAEAAADEGSMQTESDVLQGAADDMDPADYGKPEAEEKP
jgi:small subunit ribosomal protein S17